MSQGFETLEMHMIRMCQFVFSQLLKLNDEEIWKILSKSLKYIKAMTTNHIR